MIGAQHGLERDLLTAGQFNHGGFFDFRVDRADAHIQTRHVKDALQLHHVGQVKSVARVVLWNDQQILGFRANFLNGRLRCLHRQGQHFRR